MRYKVTYLKSKHEISKRQSRMTVVSIVTHVGLSAYPLKRKSKHCSIDIWQTLIYMHRSVNS